MRSEQGFSLVELMVAITVGIVLMGGVVQMFVSSKTVFSTQEGISRVQETGRLGVEFLANDIREAGFMGCISRNKLMNVTSTLNDTASALFDFDNGIQAYSAAPAGVSFAGGAPHKAETPILVLRGANRSGVSVVKTNNAANLFVSNYGATGPDCWSGLCNDDILIVTDCSKSRIFQATNVQEVGGGAEINIAHSNASATPGNKISSWGAQGKKSNPEERFDPGAEIIKLQSVVFYIGESPTTGRPGLWQKIGPQPPFELLEGVEDMYLEFAVDNNEDGIVADADFVELGDVGDWKRVVAVRVQLLVQSTDDNVVQEKQTYTFANNEVTADDYRIRQVFTSTVGIRSRLN